MEGYAVWTARRKDGDRVSIDVASAHATGMGAGSRELVEAALRTFWPERKAAGWTIAPIRSVFFTDYPDAPDWRDRWRLGWTLTVAVDGGVPDSAFHFPFEWLNTPDPSWDGVSQLDTRDANAVIFAGPPDGFAADPLAAVRRLASAGNLPCDVEQLVMKRLDGDQVRVIRAEIERPGFSEQEGASDALVAELVKGGWRTNWRDFL